MNSPRPAPNKLARPDQPELTNAVAQRDPNAPPSFKEQRERFIGMVNTGIVQALGKGTDPGQFTRSLATVINENPKLLQANQTSLAVAVLHAARLGLDLTPSLQLAYLAPFNQRQQINGKWTSVPMVKMMIGYKGFVLLARRSGLCEKVDARAVYARDSFEWEEGTTPIIRHRPFMGAERGDVIAAYCRAKVRGEMEFRVVDLPELEKAHRASNGAFEKGNNFKPDFTRPKADSPWTTHFAEMCEKTAIRRFFKGFDLTDFRHVAAAIELEDAYDHGRRIPAPASITGEPVKPPEQLSQSDEWGDDVLFGNRDEEDEQHETIVDATASETEPR